MQELDGTHIAFKLVSKDPFMIHVNQHQVARTPLDSDEETWNSLRGRCHSKEQAQKLFLTHGHARVSPQHLADLAAYIDQAENFYKSGIGLNVRSRPLMLYYSYLNLAKALLLLRTNTLPPEGHGFAMDNNIANLNQPFKKQSVQFRNKGIAIDLFTIFGIDMSDLTIGLHKTFAFIPEISGQVLRTSYSYSRLHKLGFLGGKVWRIGQEDDNWFNLLALNVRSGVCPDLTKLSGFYAPFFKLYRPIKANHDHYEMRFLDDSTRQCQFFAGIPQKLPSLKAMNQELLDSLRGTIHESVVDDDTDFYIFAPENNRSKAELNEFLAIYLATFFFSGIVRYRPAYLQYFAKQEDNWLYESFVETTPQKMLRHFHMYITKELEVLQRY